MDAYIQQVKERVEKLKYLDDKREKNLQILHERINEIRNQKSKRESERSGRQNN